MLDYNAEYSISEAAKLIGYAPHVLRYYEKEFKIDIPRRESNHRYYTYKEIETLQYIKNLKDKGFGNKQINLIINSPETVLSEKSSQDSKINNNSLEQNKKAVEVSREFQEAFFNKLSKYIETKNEDMSDSIIELKEDIQSLKDEINSKERDVLISENAKLKMKVKEKTYENVKLKDELFRCKNQRKGFLKKIFGK